MKKLFDAFEKPNLSDWKTKLIKELKSNNPKDPTAFENEIEELHFEKIYDEIESHPLTIKKNTNDWQIGVEIIVNNETEANKFALELLNLGANSLNFDVRNLDQINLSELVAGIELSYIHTYFTVKDEDQENAINSWLTDKNPLFILINTKSNFVNAAEVNTAGGNITQELAYALVKGKNILENKNHPSSIHFTFGLGAFFMLEIAKFRAFQLLWNKIETAYQLTTETTITAKTGFINKSLNDPYTNLLRQTTEGLSAVLGGVNQLIIQPYDTLSESGSTSFTQRMSINISLILKEESDINQYINPLQGSISIEKLTATIADSTWKLFQKLESLGGINSDESKSYFSKEILRIREKRLSNLKTNISVFVGINKYNEINNTEHNWLESSGNNFLGIAPLILEKEVKNKE